MILGISETNSRFSHTINPLQKFWKLLRLNDIIGLNQKCKAMM